MLSADRHSLSLHHEVTQRVIFLMQVGAMLAYMLDALRQKELAMAALWVSLALSNVTNLVATLTSGSPAPLLLKMSMIMVCSGAAPLSGPKCPRHSQPGPQRCPGQRSELWTRKPLRIALDTSSASDRTSSARCMPLPPIPHVAANPSCPSVHAQVSSSSHTAAPRSLHAIAAHPSRSSQHAQM